MASVRVQSEQYPSSSAPQSITTSSLGPIGTSRGCAWGSAPWGPAATIELNEGRLAPRSSIARSSATATLTSVRPASPAP